MNGLESIVELLSKVHSKKRIKLYSRLCESKWDKSIFSPTNGYIEGSDTGPNPTRDIEWIEVEKTEMRYIGRLVPDRPIDHSGELIKIFSDVGFKFEDLGNAYRIYNT